MTIPMLHGIGDSIAENLPQVADAIGDIVDPNRKFNQAMRMLFIQKPELMQKFVDIEKANPGTLKAFGFNQRGTDLLSGMQESLPALKDRTTRPATEAALANPNNQRVVATEQATGHTPGEISADNISEWFNNGGLQLLQTDPQSGIEALRAKYGVQTSIERRLEGATGAALDAVETPIEGKKLVDFGLPDWRRALSSGTLNSQQLSGALVDPRSKGMATMALREQEARISQSLNSFYGIQDDLERERLRRAAQMYDASGQVGSIDAWYEVANPGQHAPQSNHVVTADERAAVLQASKDERNAQLINRYRTADTTFRTAVADVGKAQNREQREAAIQNINNTLAVTHPDIEAYWNEGHIGGLYGSGLKYRRRSDGQDVSEPVVMPPDVTRSTSVPPTFPSGSRESRMLSRWQALRVQKPQGYQNTIKTELDREKAANASVGSQLEAALGEE